MRLRPKFAFFPVSGGGRSGYTLVEILVATTLTLVLMTAVVRVFGGVGEGIAKARRALEQFDRLRTAAQQLRRDLEGATVKFDGRPVRPEEGQGYLEMIEGGMLSVTQANGSPPITLQAVNDQQLTSSSGSADLTAGQRGDILMLTTRNAVQPFKGRYALSTNPSDPTAQSDVAEVAWYLRGTTLHRRVLLVAPGVARNPGFANQAKSTYYAYNDISVRQVNGQLVPNSLGDLTKRENRFGHAAASSTFPFDVRLWGPLGLPTLAECSSPSWMANWNAGSTPAPPTTISPVPKIDMWDSAVANALSAANQLPDQYVNKAAQDGVRLADDVILTNVIGFDIKVWEPSANNGAGGYVDLGYGNTGFNPNLVPPQGPSVPRFNHLGAPKSMLAATATTPRVFDSYCFSYENEGIYDLDKSGNPTNVRGPPGRATNGMDDDSDGVVDDQSESITQPPYPVALRGIQIKIRCFEPDSRQVREITIEHDFLPK